MSVIEKSVQLSKDLFAINRKTTKEMIAIQIGGMRRYVETNVEAMRHVGDIKSFPQFAEAQKSYSSTLILGVQADLIAGRDVVKGAFEDTRAAVSAVRADAPQKNSKKDAKKKPKKASEKASKKEAKKETKKAA